MTFTHLNVIVPPLSLAHTTLFPSHMSDILSDNPIFLVIFFVCNFCVLGDAVTSVC